MILQKFSVRKFQVVKRFSVFQLEDISPCEKSFPFLLTKNPGFFIYSETKISIEKVIQKLILKQMQILFFLNPKTLAHTHLQLQLASQPLCPTSPPRTQHLRVQFRSLISAKLYALSPKIAAPHKMTMHNIYSYAVYFLNIVFSLIPSHTLLLLPCFPPRAHEPF